MATKNIVPRADNEGGIGTSAKKWANVYCYDIEVADDLTVTGSLTVYDIVHFRSVMQRSKFTYNGGSTAYTVKAGTAMYFCKDKYCFWDAELTTSAISTPSSLTWYYLYLDYSAITSGTAITATELIWSSTAPTWSSSYRGWYNSDDRCVFAALTDSGPTNIREFFHDGDLVTYADEISEAFVVTPSDNWTDVDLTSSVPRFSTKAMLYFIAGYVALEPAVFLQYRTNGQTGTTGKAVGGISADATLSSNTVDVVTDSGQIIEIRFSAATAANQATVKAQGWYFPMGM